jgi:hypothetical protein
MTLGLHIVARESWDKRGHFRIDLCGGTPALYVKALQHYDPDKGWTLALWEADCAERHAELVLIWGMRSTTQMNCAYLGTFASVSQVARVLTRLLGTPVRVDRVVTLA